VGWKKSVLKVSCSACGKYIVIYQDVNLDTQRLSLHARVHQEAHESFKIEFDDSPIIFPIQFTEVIEGDVNGW
jgi:hypothetical protein